jgi:hypothetical protein
MQLAICFKDLTKSTDLGTFSPLSFSFLLDNKGSSNSGFPSAVTSMEMTFMLKTFIYTVVIVVTENQS